MNFSCPLDSQTPERDVRLEETAEIQVTSTRYFNSSEILRLVSNRYVKHHVLQRFFLLLGHLYLSCEGEGH